ncbi:MAG: DEAD/DEAH box helicase [Nitrospirales bacterium]|nr:DEAD/DEAH box helicase [Nitrospirales bacterium]
MSVEPFGVLDHLKVLSPNHVYFLASKAYVLRGYEYYAQGRLESYSWDRTQTTLAAMVRGGSQYLVRFCVHNGQLTFSCNCPVWTPESHCKHVICALLTTVNLLLPDTFRMPSSNSTQRPQLMRQLMAGAGSPSTPRPSNPTIPPRFEITLRNLHGVSSLRITNHGNLCQSFAGMPTELAVLLRATQDPAWSVQEGLRDFLKHHGQNHALFFEHADGRFPVEWAPDALYTTKTELDLLESHVLIAARCLRFGEVQRNTYACMGFAADLDAKKLGPLEHEGGWAVYDVLYENSQRERVIEPDDPLSRPLSLSPTPHFRDGWLSSEWPRGLARPPFSVPIEQFIALQFDIPLLEQDRILRSVLLKCAGQEVAPTDHRPSGKSPTYQYRLTFIPETIPLDASVLDLRTGVLRAECWLGESHGRPSVPIFRMFPFLERAKIVSNGLRAKKRRALLYDTFFQLIGHHMPSDVRKLVKACIAQDEFRPFKLKAEAEQILQRFSSPALEPSVRLVVHEGHWCLVKNDWAKEALLYAIPYALWGPSIFEGMVEHDEMSLPLTHLYPLLPDLHAKLQEVGIGLFYQDQPIATSQWDCSVDARRASSIDWFELRPELLCDGVQIEAKDIEKILERGGMIEADGVVRIVDQNTQAILRAFAFLSNKPSLDHKEQKVVVRVPKLQILDWVALRKRGVTVMLPPADEVLINRLLQFEQIEALPLPKALEATVRQYQQEGYHWLGFLYQHRLGACLADDMGLGKTLQAICLFAGIKEGIITSPEPIQGPHLVVLPPSLLFNWEHEISRFYPTLTVRSYTGKERTPSFAGADVVLTTYGLIRRDIAILEQIPFNVILFDEAQAVKNIVARTTGAARRLKGYFKCVMTGTPLENHMGEYYALMDLCVPGLLGDYEEVRGKMKAPSPALLETIMQRSRPFVLRRTKSQILKELPPKIETDLYLELTDRQKTLYQQTVTKIRSTIAAAYRSQTPAQARIIALTAILKLRQICLSPQLLSPAHTERSPKLECLLGRLTELLDEGHSALVFSQFTSFLDIVEQAFDAHEISHVRLDGSTPTPTRKKLVREFQEGTNPSIFLLSLKAGGQGLNLTKASYVFHLDPWWNPAVENQASDRAHRIGQTQNVSIMRLLMRHTIEEKMMELKQKKLDLYHAVLEGATPHGGGASLSQKDFDFLLE